MSNRESILSLLDNYKCTAILSGAGVSVPSKVPSFRGSGGLYSAFYEGYSPQEILSALFFKRNKPTFWRYYEETFLGAQYQPNELHKVARELEQYDRLAGLVTQNIDGLYTAAGVENILEIHGNCHEFFCTKCKVIKHSLKEFTKSKRGVYLCKQCGNVVRPNILLYGEMYEPHLVRAYDSILRSADSLLVMGTGLEIGFHREKVLEFSGDILLYNGEDIKLEGYAGMREWTKKIITEY